MAARILGPGEITPGILKSLIGTAEEGQTIDFKRAINVDKIEAKLDLAIDVSAFANESGGDIVFGMAQTEEGIAKELVALINFNRDDIELQFRHICQARIDPPVPGIQFVSVEFEAGQFAMVMRIPRSWDRPHCVVGNSHTWHIRDGKGNRSMKPRELKDAFTMSAEMSERMKAFRADRIAALQANTFPVVPTSMELLIIHVLPLSAFDSPNKLDLAAVLKDDLKLAHPLDYDTRDSLTARYNFDGAIVYRPGGSEGEFARCYTQLFRDGCIESLNARILEFRPNGATTGISSIYELWVEASLRRFLQLLQKHCIEPPIYIMLSMIGVRGRAIGWAVFDVLDSQPPPGAIDRDPLFLPEVRIEKFADDYYSDLKPAFDVLWQCCGLSGSVNFSEGKWSRPPESQLSRKGMLGRYS